MVGLVFAHATNNLVNDWIDSHRGIDRGNYFRTRYGTQVIEERLVAPMNFAVATGLTAVPSLLAAGYLVWSCGVEVLYLSIAGAFFLLFYTWPLKQWALGELSVLIVWGPLMTAGSYYVMAGDLTASAVVVSLIHGIGPTLVILGKHIDKHQDDAERGVCTLPVVIGEPVARKLTVLLMAVQWSILVGCIVIWRELAVISLCVLSTPVVLKVARRFRSPRPSVKPDEFPDFVWPLWYSAFTFRYTLAFGLLLIIALLIKLSLALAEDDFTLRDSACHDPKVVYAIEVARMKPGRGGEVEGSR